MLHCFRLALTALISCGWSGPLPPSLPCSNSSSTFATSPGSSKKIHSDNLEQTTPKSSCSFRNVFVILWMKWNIPSRKIISTPYIILNKSSFTGQSTVTWTFGFTFFCKLNCSTTCAKCIPSVVGTITGDASYLFLFLHPQINHRSNKWNNWWCRKFRANEWINRG